MLLVLNFLVHLAGFCNMVLMWSLMNVFPSPIMRGGWGSGVMSDLEAMVHTCPSVQEKLGPALLRTYVSVDVVEGLDVDKDTFDKYGAR